MSRTQTSLRLPPQDAAPAPRSYSLCQFPLPPQFPQAVHPFNLTQALPLSQPLNWTQSFPMAVPLQLARSCPARSCQADQPRLVLPSFEPASGDRELQILQWCARTHLDGITQAQLQQGLRSPLDWQRLLQLAVRHRVLPLLYQHLSQLESTRLEAMVNAKQAAPDRNMAEESSEHDPEAVSAEFPIIPTTVLRALQDHCQENVQHNLRQTWALLKLLEHFDHQGIPVIPFKGPLLAVVVYRDLGLRRFADLDLLVQPQQVPAVEALLTAAGYELQKRLSWESSWVDPRQQVAIDLHWAIAPAYFPLNFRFEQLYERRQPALLGGKAIPHLSPEDLLLILCANFCRDSIERKPKLSQLCDIAELLRSHPQLDWVYLITQAYELGVQQIWSSSLHLAQELLDAPLPEYLDVQDPSYPIQLKLALQSEPHQALPEEPWWSNAAAHNHRLALQLRDRRRDQVQYLAHSILVASEEEPAIAPEHSSPPWRQFFLRLQHLLQKYRICWEQQRGKLENV